MPRTLPRTYPDSTEEVRAATHPRGGGRKRARPISQGSYIAYSGCGQGFAPCMISLIFSRPSESRYLHRVRLLSRPLPSVYLFRHRIPSVQPDGDRAIPDPSCSRRSGYRPARHPWTECRGRCGGMCRILWIHDFDSTSLPVKFSLVVSILSLFCLNHVTSLSHTANLTKYSTARWCQRW